MLSTETMVSCIGLYVFPTQLTDFRKNSHHRSHRVLWLCLSYRLPNNPSGTMNSGDNLSISVHALDACLAVIWVLKDSVMGIILVMKIEDVFDV